MFGLGSEDAEKNQEKSLLDVSEKGKVVEATKLLDAGVDQNCADNWSNTALHFAAANGRGMMVEILLARNANVYAANMIGNTPLHDAVIFFSIARHNRLSIQCCPRDKMQRLWRISLQQIRK